MLSDFVHAIVLAVIQGITEFLPVSSSAHLILVPHLLGWQDQGLAFDIAVHFGTLIAVVAVLRMRLKSIAIGMLRHPFDLTQTPTRLGWALVIGTIPIILAGLLFGDLVETHLRTEWIIATTTIVFALALWLAETKSKHQNSVDNLSLKAALLIGLAQVIALIPGTSRSGITMTAALLLGMERRAAAEFSFLLSVPTILLAAGWQLLKFAGSETAVNWASLSVGFFVSAIFAYATIRLFLAAMDRIGLMPFVVYRLALGLLLLAVF